MTADIAPVPRRDATPPDEQAACRVCGARGLDVFFRQNGVPVQVGILFPTREAALAAPTGDLRMAFCGSCGYIGNLAFDASKKTYGPEYDFSLHYSPVYQEFVEELVDELVRKHDLHGKDVLEIACGQGDFLRALCLAGGNRGLGFDPSYAGGPLAEGDPFEIVPDYYSEVYSGRPADFVACRHMLDSHPDPRGFLQTVRRAIGDRAQTVFYVEVPSAVRVFAERMIWNLVYEHCSYFSPSSLARLYVETGFEVLATGPRFHGDYVGIEGRPGTSRETPDVSPTVEQLAAQVAGFEQEHRRKAALWEERLAGFRRTGQRVAVWGAGARGISFFHMFRVGEEIPYAVDINPRRQGLHMAGTGQPVRPPEFLREWKPDVLIISNPTFENEIRRQAADLGLDCTILVLD